MDAALAEADHVLKGECRVGGQDHFYLETQACLVVPRGEDAEMEIISSSQGLMFVQTCAAIALGIPCNRIVAKIKRIGMCPCMLLPCECFLMTPSALLMSFFNVLYMSFISSQIRQESRDI